MTKTDLEFRISVIVICLIFVICYLEFLFLQYPIVTNAKLSFGLPPFGLSPIGIWLASSYGWPEKQFLYCVTGYSFIGRGSRWTVVEVTNFSLLFTASLCGP